MRLLQVPRRGHLRHARSSQQRGLAVIAATGGGPSSLAPRPATAMIPIVFVMGNLAPVRAGLVTSLNHPGANVTGLIPLMSLLVKRV